MPAVDLTQVDFAKGMTNLHRRLLAHMRKYAKSNTLPVTAVTATASALALMTFAGHEAWHELENTVCDAAREAAMSLYHTDTDDQIIAAFLKALPLEYGDVPVRERFFAAPFWDATQR